MENEQFKPIEEPPKNNTNQMNLPNLKNNPEQNNTEEIINKLPEWNIEPPIEINRGQQ